MMEHGEVTPGVYYIVDEDNNFIVACEKDDLIVRVRVEFVIADNFTESRNGFLVGISSLKVTPPRDKPYAQDNRQITVFHLRRKLTEEEKKEAIYDEDTLLPLIESLTERKEEYNF